MKKIFVLILAILFSGFVFADEGGYDIQNYQVNMSLNADGSMDVSEKIDVNFTSPRHGIYRTIPKNSNQGYRHIQNLSANSETFSTTADKNNYQIKIGDKDKTISGPHSYNISYKVLNAVKQYSGFQELYWNVIGTDWATNINSGSFVLNFPKQTNFLSGDIDSYGGNAGSKSKIFLVQKISSTSYQGQLIAPLSSNQGATVVFKLPQNYLILDEKYNKLFLSDPTYWSNFGGKLAIGLMIVFFGGMFGFFIVMILGTIYFGIKENTKKKSIPTVVQYLPPNISVTEAAVFWTKSTQPKNIIPAIYDWGAKGLLTIQQKEEKTWGIFNTKKIIISKTPLGLTLPAGEDKLFEKFFSAGDIIDISEKKYLLQDKIFSGLTSIFSALVGKKYLEYPKGLFDIKVNGNRMSNYTSSGWKLYGHLKGYKEFLSKVEKPVLENELKNDPSYLSKILPWAVIFGVESRIINQMQEYLQNINWYQGENFSPATFSYLNNNLSSSFTSSSDSGSSGSGSSGGGGGGGGGGSW